MKMDWRGKRVLINGITGFIGSNLGRELKKRGAIIHSIDNFSYIDFDIAREKIEFLNEVNLVFGDVSKKETWAKVPKDIEYIFHFAAPSSITLFKKNPEKCYNETVFGFRNALEFAKEFGVQKVIYPSSGSNYAGNEFPHREDIYPQPRNLYAAAKIACEGLANSYADFVNCIGLRIFGGYGPGEEWKKDFGSVLYLFIRDYMEGKSPVIWGDGNQTRDFVYIDDIVEMVILSAEVGHKGVVNVGTGRAISFKNLLESIKITLNAEKQPEFIPKDKNYVDNIKADPDLMKNLFGIEPLSVEEGIRKFVNYLKTGQRI